MILDRFLNYRCPGEAADAAEGALKPAWARDTIQPLGEICGSSE